MTITAHAAKRIQQRYITERMIQKCIKYGQIIILDNNKVKITDGIIILILSADTLITAHYTTKINNLIYDLAQKQGIKFHEAIKYFVA